MKQLISDKATPKARVLIIAGVVALVVGVLGWLMSDVSSNMDQENVWGLCIAVFFALEALCAGSLFIAAVDKQSNRPVLAFSSVIFALGASLAIIADLGTPLQMWRLFLTPNIMSPVLLDVIFVSLAIVMGIVLYLMATKGLAETTVGKVVSIISAAVAVCLPIGTSWLCTTLTGRVGWSHSLEIFLFVLAALVAGLLYEMLVCKVDRTKITAILLFVNAGAILCELGLALYTNGNDMISTMELATGSYGVLFWIHLLVGVVVPAVMLIANKYTTAACWIAMVGIFLGKFLYLVKGNLYTRATIEDFALSPVYFPAVGEWGSSLLIIAFVVIMLGIAFLPAKQPAASTPSKAESTAA